VPIHKTGSEKEDASVEGKLWTRSRIELLYKVTPSAVFGDEGAFLKRTSSPN